MTTRDGAEALSLPVDAPGATLSVFSNNLPTAPGPRAAPSRWSRWWASTSASLPRTPRGASSHSSFPGHRRPIGTTGAGSCATGCARSPSSNRSSRCPTTSAKRCVVIPGSCPSASRRTTRPCSIPTTPLQRPAPDAWSRTDEFIRPGRGRRSARRGRAQPGPGPGASLSRPRPAAGASTSARPTAATARGRASSGTARSRSERSTARGGVRLHRGTPGRSATC